MRTIIFSLLFLFVLTSNGQDFGTRSRQYFAMDVITGGLIGGIGSAFHPKESQTRGNAFLKGFAKGCLGGSLTFTGKYMVSGIQDKQNYLYGWPAKLVHAAGSSIIENSARNAALYDNWAIDYGAIRVDVNYKGKSKVRLQPTASLGFIASFIAGGTFDIGRTLAIGTPYFKYYDTQNNTTDAYTFFNSISLNTFRYQKIGTDNIYNASGHELIHCFQQREWLSVNNIYLKNNKKFVYFDIPVFEVPYYLGSIRNKTYYSNPYENQAETLSKHKFIQ